MSAFYSKLIKVQATLNAPKGQYNSFGKYAYRSCEDIMAAVKPLLAEHGLVQFISDDIVLLGDRYYVKSTVTITDGETSHSVSAFARESLDKKGMDAAQITGATSSYARKYALNGAYNIDDTKDADTNEVREQAKNNANNTVKKQVNSNVEKLSAESITKLSDFIVSKGYTVEQICQSYNVASLAEFNADMAAPVCMQINEWVKQSQQSQNGVK